MFRGLVLTPDNSQILTTGSNKKITYWDLIDEQDLRSVDGALDGGLTTLDIFESGEHFVSAGEDKEVKIWTYDECDVVYSGVGHSKTINKVRIAPNQQFIVSVAEDGSIYFWDVPKQISLAKADYEMP